MRFLILFIILIFTLTIFQSCAEEENKEIAAEKLTRIKSGDKYGYIGVINGKKIFIEPQYDFAWDFSEGLAVIEIAGKQGFIDINGETVIQPIFDKAYSFSEGFAKIKMGGKYGYIDKNGKIVIGVQFDDAGDFNRGIARVLMGKEKYFIDKAGNKVTNNDINKFQYHPLNYNEL